MKIKLVVIDFELSARAKRIAAAVAIPMLVLGGGAVAYANVPHTWQDGDTLTAADLNANFDALDRRVDGQLAMSNSSGLFQTQSDTPVAVPNNEVQLDTSGGLVRLELAPDSDATTGSRFWVIGAGGGPDPWLVGFVQFERSTDGVQWDVVKGMQFAGVPNAAGSTMVPPGAFTHYDAPPAGTWFYRITTYRKANAGDLTVHVDNVRLIARELGVTP